VKQKKSAKNFISSWSDNGMKMTKILNFDENDTNKPTACLKRCKQQDKESEHRKYILAKLLKLILKHNNIINFIFFFFFKFINNYTEYYEKMTLSRDRNMEKTY